MAAMRDWISLILAWRALSADSRFSSSARRCWSHRMVPSGGSSVEPSRLLTAANDPTELNLPSNREVARLQDWMHLTLSPL